MTLLNRTAVAVGAFFIVLGLMATHWIVALIMAGIALIVCARWDFLRDWWRGDL